MSITIDTLHEIERALVESAKMRGNPLLLLKDCFPGVSFVGLSASDINEPPFRSLTHYNLYLLDTRDHCVQITSDPSMATGLVIAHR